MKRELVEVQTGQIWRDRDKRMMSGNRRVCVSHVEMGKGDVGQLVPMWVFYRDAIGLDNDPTGPMHRSRLDRFQRAFDFVR